MSLPDKDFLTAATTTLAGILLFITIERKFDIKKAMENLDLWVNKSQNEDELQKKLAGAGKEELETLAKKLRENAKENVFGVIQRQYIQMKTLEGLITLFMFAALLSCISLIVLDAERIALGGFQLSRFLYVASLVLLFVRIYLHDKGR
jgi:hypothetical protein